MNNKALTMLELVLVIALLGFALVGLLVSYVSSLNLSEYDKDLTIAMNIAREKMEELYNQRFEDFDTLGVSMCDSEEGCLVTGDNNLRVVSFSKIYVQNNYNDFNGSCAIYITKLDENLKEARTVVCWKQNVGRITGEDKDLDGTLDGNEDAGGHVGQLDSPCELISAFAKR
ncbi:MAG: type II secretion system protein [Candidatus Omnitrophica bacterium]|nr:type II secretion system protein [Candidatus Omnitrophota bacterium]